MALPFVLQFHRTLLRSWTDDNAKEEQGDPLMPMLHALCQHQAFRSVQSHFGAGESLFAFHDDICIVSQFERQIHIGKSGTVGDSSWRTQRRRSGLVIWKINRRREYNGQEFVQKHVIVWNEGHDWPHTCVTTQQLLLDRIPLLPEVQSAWALLVHCTSARAQRSFQFAISHDTAFDSWDDHPAVA